MQTNIVHADTRGMSREDWLDARRNGIGGSDAGAIMGVSKWSSPLSVYVDKIGMSPEKEITEAMRQGTDLEDYVAKRFCEDTGMKVRKCNRILKHPEHEWMLANIDRDIIGVKAGLECKTSSPMTRCDYDAGEIPPQYYYQCLHYMAVTGAEKWYLAVLVYSKALHVFEIKRDESKIKELIEHEREFWFDCVLQKNPPLPTGSEADEKAVNIFFPMVDDAESVDLGDLKETLQMLEYQKASKKKIDENISELEGQIKMRMSSHAIGSTDGWKVTWKQSDRSNFDKAALLNDHPELAPLIAQYTTTKPSRRFMVTKINA